MSSFGYPTGSFYVAQVVGVSAGVSGLAEKQWIDPR